MNRHVLGISFWESIWNWKIAKGRGILIGILRGGGYFRDVLSVLFMLWRFGAMGQVQERHGFVDAGLRRSNWHHLSNDTRWLLFFCNRAILVDCIRNKSFTLCKNNIKGT